jgi:predicted nucleic acid-binding protein
VTVYLDTSSLVKLYINEPGTDDVTRLVRDADVVATSVLAYPEMRATLARRRRERLMTTREHAAAVAQLDADWPRFLSLAFTTEMAVAAGRLAQKHRLRGADSAHLASFELLLATTGGRVTFSCADDQLTRAAKSLG